MKKFKSLVLLSSVLIMAIINLPLLNAASNRIEIVTKAKQYVFKDANQNSVGVLKQEIVEQDLVKGNITVELTLNNAKSSEIIYIFNGTNATATVNNIKTLTDNLFNAMGSEYTKIGTIFVTDTLVNKPLSNDANVVKEKLDELTTLQPLTGKTLNEAVATAKTTFSSDVDNKVLVIIDDTKTATDVMSSITETLTGIKVITLTSTTATLTNATSAANITDVQTAVTATLIPDKNNASIAMPLANYITKNFNVSLVGNPTDATIDTNNNTINWNLGTVKSNEIKTLRYKLELKSAIDESIIGLELLINEAPTIMFNGATVANTAANQCSPVIKILDEAVVNPKTGIANYIIFGSALLVIGASSYVVTRKKSLSKI